MLDRAHLSPRKTVALGLALSFALVASACSKTEGQGSAATSDTATAPPPSAAPAAADPSAATAASETPEAAAPTAEATTADATTPTAAAATGAGAKAPASAAVAASAEPGPAACGKKPLPDCPLQAWMKANTNSAIASRDLPALATALDKTAGFAPPGYTNWVSIAKDGAKAARADDLTAAKASCRTCHDQYKKKYKAELRDRKI